MSLLKKIGYSIVAGIATVFIFFWGAIISVITFVGSLLLLFLGIFTAVFYVVWESQQKKPHEEDDP